MYVHPYTLPHPPLIDKHAHHQALSDALDRDMPPLPAVEEEEDKGGGVGLAVWDGALLFLFGGGVAVLCVYIYIHVCVYNE